MQAKKLQAAALSTQPVFVESVFSTYLYTGNGSTQTITNGIDLAGEGGLVWIKRRDTTSNHFLTNTTNTPGDGLRSNTTDALETGRGFTSFNSNGFSLSADAVLNGSAGSTYASWTFRKQPKFFDVVTYTGDGATFRNLSHSLNGDVGAIIVKRTDSTGDWYVISRNSNASNGVRFTKLNSTAAGAYDGSNLSTYWTNTTFRPALVDPAATNTNINGATYVAYLFAHDAGGFGESGEDNVISCGSFEGNGGAVSVNLGYEPQWILYRRSDSTSYWHMLDNMRGVPTGGNDSLLWANVADAESTSADQLDFNATGFTIKNTAALSVNGANYIYIAIRRGPMKTPTTGTSVFTPVTQTLATGSFVNTGFVTDMGLSKALSTADPLLESRLTKAYLRTNTTGAESSGSSTWDYMNGYGPTPWSGSGLSSVAYGFRRAPGFFDVVCYTGTGATNAVQHNLGVTPEMVIVKRRDAAATSWSIYNKFLNGGTNPFNYALYFDASDPTANDTYFGAAPTSTTFTVKTRIETNASGGTYVAYLFASAPGVSKVFSYTGNGSSQTINCGFTGGARFVLIKRTDSTGDWYVWDSARGIVAGNDPHLSLNSTAAEVTTDDSVDTDSTGFIVNQLAATNINVNAATYIGLAIA